MKKFLLTVTAVLVAMTMSAQTNLALNKTATASASEGGRTPELAVDGNTGTQWGSNTGDADTKDAAWWQVDLGEAQTFNSVQIMWDNEPAESFKLQKSDDGETFTDIATFSGSGADANTTRNYDFDAVTARYIRFQGVKRVTGWGYGFYEFRVFNKTDEAKLTSMTLTSSTPFLKAGETADLTLAGVDQYGSEFDVSAAKISSDDGTVSTDGKTFTAETKDGWATITATLGDVTATAKVYVYDETAPTYTAQEGDELIYDGTTSNWCDAGWDWGGKQADIDLGDGNKARLGYELGSMMIPFDADLSKHGKIRADIFSIVDTNIQLTLEHVNGIVDNAAQTVSLKEGWNAVEVNLSGYGLIGEKGTDQQYLHFRYSTPAVSDHLLIIDNIYATGEPNTTGLAVSTTPDAQGFYTVSGTINAENKSEIEGTDVTAIDLSKATIEDGTGTLNMTNPNTIVAVAGTVDGNNATTTVDLGETKNVVVRQTWIFPVKQLEFTDGTPVFTSNVISTGDKGYKYTRTIAANAWATAYLPAAAEAVEGLSVYTLDSYTNGTLNFKKQDATTIPATTPVLIHNSNASEVTISATGTGDLNLTTAGKTEKGDVAFNGNYAEIDGNGTQWGIQNSTGETPEIKNVAAGAKIGAFRAYITGITANTNAKINILDGDATGINGVKSAEENVKDQNVYTITGQRVNSTNLPAGLYIINGKKIIKK